MEEEEEEEEHERRLVLGCEIRGSGEEWEVVVGEERRPGEALERQTPKSLSC